MNKHAAKMGFAWVFYSLTKHANDTWVWHVKWKSSISNKIFFEFCREALEIDDDFIALIDFTTRIRFRQWQRH